MSYPELTHETLQFLEEKCFKIRGDILNLVYRFGMGHLGGELSMVEVAVALYYRYMNWDPTDVKNEDRDRFILSKAHCSETLYSIFADRGIYTQDYIVEHFECLDKSRFGQHSNRKYVPAIEVSAGSLGHGLPIGVGYALGARTQKRNYRVIVMVGDGELDEGSNWEAMQAAAQFQLANLVCIVDRNRLQMTGFTEEVMAQRDLTAKAKAFGWDTMVIDDGNDIAQVCAALEKLPERDYACRRAPLFIVSNTVKGKGVDFMEDTFRWHGGGLAKEQLDQALASIEKNRKKV